MTQLEGHGGDLIAEAMRSSNVDVLFTLSGGHIFPIYDGLHTRGMRIVDTRHEQSAAFAAEAYGKLARRPGVAALTAGPGITNGISAITSAWFNGSPMVVLGGRAPQVRWGQGSLQEMDHVPLLAPVTKRSATVFDPALIGEEMVAALSLASAPHRGPVFLDFPMDAIFSRAGVTIPAANVAATPIGGDAEQIVALLRDAERPAILLGADVWQGSAESQALAFVEACRVPAFMNGMGRGIIPADHELAFAQARGAAFKEADLVIVAGTPLDFRLGFGSFGNAKVVHLADTAAGVASHVALAGSAHGSFCAIFDALADAAGARDRSDWITRLRSIEEEKRAGFKEQLSMPSAPIHPARVYGELLPRLQRDAIVICDGGDFVSYAGKFVDVYQPGGWLDPGPYGCLGTGPGYALAAGVLYPDRQIVVMMGDGAAGFAMGDWDTLVRFGIDVTFVIGNNGIWGLEKHPMEFLYQYSVAADLTPMTRYDQVMESLGGSGWLVANPDKLGSSLEEAFSTPGPSVVNVITDPAIAYPRTSNLA